MIAGNQELGIDHGTGGILRHTSCTRVESVIGLDLRICQPRSRDDIMLRPGFKVPVLRPYTRESRTFGLASHDALPFEIAFPWTVRLV